MDASVHREEVSREICQPRVCDDESHPILWAEPDSKLQPTVPRERGGRERKREGEKEREWIERERRK